MKQSLVMVKTKYITRVWGAVLIATALCLIVFIVVGSGRPDSSGQPLVRAGQAQGGDESNGRDPVLGSKARLEVPIDALADDVLDVEMAEALQMHQVRQVVRPSRWHTERVKTIRSESVETLVQNLANFDDNLFAMTVQGTPFIYGEHQSEMSRIAHLARVRRLFELAETQPGRVSEVLRRGYQQSLEHWLSARQARIELKAQYPDGFSIEEPLDSDHVMVRATAATYLIAELRHHDFLPELWDGIQQQIGWVETIKPYPFNSTPVPISISLYAAHRMVATYPSDKLNAQARQEQERYLLWAGEHIERLITRKESRWDTEFDTSDPAFKLADTNGHFRQTVPLQNLLLYPAAGKNGAEVLDVSGESLSDFGKEWNERLDQAIQAIGRP